MTFNDLEVGVYYRTSGYREVFIITERDKEYTILEGVIKPDYDTIIKDRFETTHRINADIIIKCPKATKIAKLLLKDHTEINGQLVPYIGRLLEEDKAVEY